MNEEKERDKELRFQQKWEGPPFIHAAFYVKGSLISRILLSPSKTFGCSIYGQNLLSVIIRWMEGYREKKHLSLPIDTSSFSPFMLKGLNAIRTIPFGKVLSYQAIAEQVGKKRAARLIGKICNKNPYPLFIPCHRVIRKDGSIGGFAYDLEMKRSLLHFESTS